MAAPHPLLSVEDLRVSVRTGLGWLPVVRGVSFTVAPGETLGLVGESGSGKTVTVSAVPQLLPGGMRINGGAVRFRGENLIETSRGRLAELRGKDISMVFQDSLAALNPIMRIGKQVREPLLLHGMAGPQEADALVEAGLRRLGIADPAQGMQRYPHEFSGGMRQRAMIATALIASPGLIIADEPTTALDATVQAQIIETWSKLNSEMGVALILVSHDLGVVAEICDSLAVMYAGRIVEMGAAEVLLANPRHPYTQALLESMPSANLPRDERLKAIPGEPPAIGALPTGCPFHPRCPQARDLCRSSEPSLSSVALSRVACWVAQGEAAAGRHAPAPSVAPAAPLRSAPAEAQPGTADEILVLDRVSRHYLVPGLSPFARPTRVHALDDVSLTLRRGETLGVAGESGCGKSTLAKCILRLVDVDQGRILFRGADITRAGGAALRGVRRHVQPVFQDPYGALNPRARIADIVAEPLLAHGADKKASARRVTEVLDFVGLGRRFESYLPHQLSGGQRQRVGIARALSLNPELIVADEPISALDVSIQAQVLNLLKDLQRDFGLTLVFISHDLRIVRYLSTHVAIMFLGSVVEYGAAEAVCARPMHPYTAALLSSVPDMRSRGQRILLQGEPPSPSAPPSGCRFRTRCPHARGLCAELVPRLERLPDGRDVACHFPGIADLASPDDLGLALSPVQQGASSIDGLGL
ncbi:MAG TPA: ABC transporter ATP-binding protein [Lichenihabitans sp.]|nr:ABC transporter ATP-binding protein [Lichenihabitans sp.]